MTGSRDHESHALRHVLWLGGPPASGKSTIAKWIARRHGLRWYNADSRTWAHRDRALAARHPAAIRWEAMTPEERWVTATPAEMLELSLQAERAPMIVEDVRRLPASPSIVAEGTSVLPSLVASGAAEASRAVWLLPTPECLRARLGERHLPHGPRQLHVLLAAEIERDVRKHGVTVVHVDESSTVEETLAEVEELFAKALAEGPRAQGAAERHALVRWANEEVVAQCLAYLARPWTTGDPESFVRAFACECDDPECREVVELAVAAFSRSAAAGPVVAHGRPGMIGP